eukprot:15970-Heterococcus_DN1.PRE.4
MHGTFFTRYTGWAPLQLAEEVKAGVWYLAACDTHTLLQQHNAACEQPDTLWKDILKERATFSAITANFRSYVGRAVYPLGEKLAAAPEQYVYAYVYAHMHTELQRAMDELKTATSWSSTLRD